MSCLTVKFDFFAFSNRILGRGKSIVVEAIIPDKIVKSVLKSSVYDMIETNKQKNHIGSAMAGTYSTAPYRTASSRTVHHCILSV